jgi:hypothetical protein
MLTGGPMVDAIWRWLLERAGPRPGFPLTSHSDMHLLVNGSESTPVWLQTVATFPLACMPERSADRLPRKRTE